MIIQKIISLFFIITTLALSPLFYLLTFLKRGRGKDLNTARILVLHRMTKLGDMVCATPVFRAIKAQYPKTFLAIVVITEQAAGIIRNNPHLDQIIFLNKIPQCLGFLERVRFFNSIRRKKFDWMISLTNDPFHTLVGFYGLIPNRVKTIRQHRVASEILTDWLNNHKLLYKDHAYLPAHYLKLLNFLGIFNAPEIKEVFPTESANKKIDQFLVKNNLSKENFLIGISVTAGNKIKEWGTKNFAILADELIGKYKVKIIFIGSANDEAAIQETQGLMRNSNQSFSATSFSIEGLPSLLKILRIFVSVDTGPIHVAHALNIPVVDIIGPLDANEQAPLGEYSLWVMPPTYIKPSLFVMKKPGTLTERKQAIESIKVEDVLSAVEKLIQKVQSKKCAQ